MDHFWILDQFQLVEYEKENKCKVVGDFGILGIVWWCMQRDAASDPQRAKAGVAVPVVQTFNLCISYLAPSGGLGSCLGLRTGVSPHFSTSSKREMLADHERGAASPPRAPCRTLGLHSHSTAITHRLRPDDCIGRRRPWSTSNDIALLPTLCVVWKLSMLSTGPSPLFQIHTQKC